MGHGQSKSARQRTKQKKALNARLLSEANGNTRELEEIKTNGDTTSANGESFSPPPLTKQDELSHPLEDNIKEYLQSSRTLEAKTAAPKRPKWRSNAKWSDANWREGNAYISPDLVTLAFTVLTVLAASLPYYNADKTNPHTTVGTVGINAIGNAYFAKLTADYISLLIRAIRERKWELAFVCVAGLVATGSGVFASYEQGNADKGPGYGIFMGVASGFGNAALNIAGSQDLLPSRLGPKNNPRLRELLIANLDSQLNDFPQFQSNPPLGGLARYVSVPLISVILSGAMTVGMAGYIGSTAKFWMRWVPPVAAYLMSTGFNSPPLAIGAKSGIKLAKSIVEGILKLCRKGLPFSSMSTREKKYFATFGLVFYPAMIYLSIFSYAFSLRALQESIKADVEAYDKLLYSWIDYTVTIGTPVFNGVIGHKALNALQNYLLQAWVSDDNKNSQELPDEVKYRIERIRDFYNNGSLEDVIQVAQEKKIDVPEAERSTSGMLQKLKNCLPRSSEKLLTDESNSYFAANHVEAQEVKASSCCSRMFGGSSSGSNRQVATASRRNSRDDSAVSMVTAAGATVNGDDASTHDVPYHAANAANGAVDRGSSWLEASRPGP